jgi:hypothetical protein
MHLQVPLTRWDVDQGWAGETSLPKRFGSIVDGAELFDHHFFAVSLQEVRCGKHQASLACAVLTLCTLCCTLGLQAAAMDAQQRLLLEACWEALSAGASDALRGSDAKTVGVSVGISYNEYHLNSTHKGMTAYTATSGTLSAVCGRISFSLGLKVWLHRKPCRCYDIMCQQRQSICSKNIKRTGLFTIHPPMLFLPGSQRQH